MKDEVGEPVDVGQTGEAVEVVEPVSIWARPERPVRASRRSSPGPNRSFSRSQITAAAIRIADAEGLEAASMRRIAADIGAGAMTLYRYVPHREDLVELMIDEVAGEMDFDGKSFGGWREALTEIAVQRRALWLKHPWLATRMPGHPIWGPNTLRQLEFTLSVFDGHDLPVDELTGLYTLLSSYVEGFARDEVGWDQEALHTHVDMREWMRRSAPYARELVASGRYPRFSRMLHETVTAHLEPDARFHEGLERVMDAIQAWLPESAPS
ncbi:TetR/AcrR family transcriptional regulator [Kineosporia sp. NBRC 101731]|uniref:TetR/AcrR family transcriptional regulator n=1 Tax=Kineosporia sp. NBRC 101731 TaxID=3032199 RepID=UPI0024A4955E|nr:TetR/AcrR family transcriptional regulator [Kineosporia sp. NBRC 101731]GLY32465.1 TetR family transcriptional regulator [Kineosporia sp. NBRC 101731]